MQLYSIIELIELTGQSYVQAVFVLPTLYPVTSTTLNYAPVAVGIVLLGTLFVWVLPVVGARHWYHGAAAASGSLAKLRELKEYDDSLKAGSPSRPTV